MKKQVLEALLELGFPYHVLSSDVVAFEYADTHILYEYDKDAPRMLKFTLYHIFDANDYTTEQQLAVMNEVNGYIRYISLFKTEDNYSLTYEHICSKDETHDSLVEIIDHMLSLLLVARYHAFDYLNQFKSDEKDEEDDTIDGANEMGCGISNEILLENIEES